MKRFFQIVCKNICDESGRRTFEAKCSCAVACGYVPVNGSLQNLDNRALFVQSFCDQNGTTTMICAHCTKCESCQLAPQSDVYCEEFEDKCYAEE